MRSRNLSAQRLNHVAERETEDWQNGGFGLYLHWPFCQSKCPYCDFNSHVSAQIDQSDWAKAYALELDRVAAQTKGRILQSVYFGGGTPSLMEPHLVDSILDRVRANWSLANDIEITLEANPTSVEISKFQDFRSAGVNRVSLGVQSLRDIDLQRLGRLHSGKEARSALEIAQKTFDRTSFDLIYARQDQTIEDWEAELREAIDLCKGHLSLYQLTIEQGTAFGDRYNAGKLRGLPDEDVSTDMYELTQSVCSDVGLNAYEVSNHAVSGHESIHNRIYWNYGDYIGIGPGAHGRLTLEGQKFATTARYNPTKWLESVLARDGQAEKREALDLDTQAIEYLMMGLRVSEGIDIGRFDFLQATDIKMKYSDLAGDGFLSLNENNLRATQKGRPLLNAILRTLLP